MQRCEACGGVHPVPADVLRAAQAYRAARANMPLQLRESADITMLAGGAERALRGFRIAAGIMGAPLALLFVIGCILASGRSFDASRERAFLAPGLLAPLIVLLVIGWLVRRELVARRTAIESLMWARPVADVPGAFMCRMCSAPIEANESKSASVSCRYCGTPNMVSPEVSRSAAKLAMSDYAEHARAVLARVEKRWQRWGVPAFAAPVIVGAALYFGGASWAKARASEERPIDSNEVFQRTTCADYSWGRLSRTGAVPASHACAGETTHRSVTPLPVASLLGARVGCDPVWEKANTTTTGTPTLKVIGLFVDGLGRPKVRVDAGFGLHGTCLVEGLEVLVPPAEPPPKAFTPEEAPKPPAIPEPPLDSPTWPAKERRVTLTWRVPVIAKDEAESEQPIDLAVRVGGVTHRVELGILHEGSLVPRFQKPCRSTSAGPSPSGGRDDARLALGTAGDYGYAVRRESSTTLAILSYSTDDGNCPDEKGEAQACAPQSLVIRRVTIPEGAAPEERVVTVDAAGKEHAFACAK